MEDRRDRVVLKGEFDTFRLDKLPILGVVYKPRFDKKKLNWHLPKAPLRRTRPLRC